MLKSTRKSEAFGVEVKPGAVLDPESNPWWWNPNRVGVRVGGPSDFSRKLEELDDSLEITWNAYTQRWQIWTKSERIQNKICSGWMFLFSVHPRELDERVLARLYMSSTKRWSSGRHYFDAIEREYWREKEARERADLQDTLDASMETFDYSQIKVSGYGPSSGSKFSTYHS